MMIATLLTIHLIITAPVRADAHSKTAQTRAWLGETAQLIESHFWNAAEKVYLEEVEADGKPGRQPAFMWAMGVLLLGYAQAIRVDGKTYRPLFEKALTAIDPYWSKANGLKGYSVLPRQSEPDRYYDDNAWVALTLCEAYEATRDKKFLKKAQETYAFVVSCEDDKLGGGLYWHEPERKSKNVCTNAPAINVALRLYRATKNRRYLDDALRLYAWAKRLQDWDGLFFDNIASDGRIERMKWTYNKALMVRANCLFHRILNDSKYRDEAARMAEAAYNKWHRHET